MPPASREPTQGSGSEAEGEDEGKGGFGETDEGVVGEAEGPLGSTWLDAHECC